MSPLALITTQIFSYATVATQALSVFLIVILLARKSFMPQIKFFGDRAIFFSFLIVLGTMLGSLFYSDIIGYEPCTLCWYQRIFMYPQVFLLGFALIRKDKSIIPYSLLLSAVGAAIAGYHYLIQMGVTSGSFCLTAESSVSCAQRYFLSFGYITIPMMSLSIFTLIILLMVSSIVSRREA